MDLGALKQKSTGHLTWLLFTGFRFVSNYRNLRKFVATIRLFDRTKFGSQRDFAIFRLCAVDQVKRGLRLALCGLKHPDWGAIGSSSSDNDNSDDDSDNITATRIKPTIQG